MAHCEKFKVCDAKKIFKEITRESEYYKNDVDSSRMHLDYQINIHGKKPIIENASKMMASNMQSRIDNLDYRKRKDTVGLCNWVVTCPEEFKDNIQKQDEFFHVVYNFTSERYGVDNVLHGLVHNDEATPHMHIPVIPVVKGKNKYDNDRLNAKEFLTRSELHNYQADLEKECEKAFKIKGLVLNGKTKGNYTTAELKERTIQEQQLKARELDLISRESLLRASERALRASESNLIEREKDLQEKEQEIKKRYDILGMQEKLSKAEVLAKPVIERNIDMNRFNLR